MFRYFFIVFRNLLACDYWCSWSFKDADRLDALGAVGIARAFTYGGMKNRPFYTDAPPEENLTKEKYVSAAHNQNASTINHFHEKLLKLKDMMKTKSGYSSHSL